MSSSKGRTIRLRVIFMQAPFRFNVTIIEYKQTLSRTSSHFRDGNELCSRDIHMNAFICGQILVPLGLRNLSHAM